MIPGGGKMIILLTAIFAGSLLLFSNGFARTTSIPECEACQLEVYLVAVDHPGMSKSYSMYGVINKSTRACKLSGTPTIWAVTKKGVKSYATGRQSSRQDVKEIVIEPSGNQDYVLAKNMVWFSLPGSSACDPDSPGFDKIRIRLPGLAGKKTFTIEYRGYTDCGLQKPSVLQKDAMTWDVFQGDDCKYGDSGPSWGETAKEAKDVKVYFKKVADCG